MYLPALFTGLTLLGFCCGLMVSEFLSIAELDLFVLLMTFVATLLLGIEVVIRVSTI